MIKSRSLVRKDYSEAPIESSRDDSWIFSTYNLFLGFKYVNNGQMTRLGERLTFTSPITTRTYRLTVLAGDDDMNGGGFGAQLHETSHPDPAGLMGLFHVQDSGGVTTGPAAGQGTSVDPQTRTQWQGPARGPIDNNFVLQSGEVVRERQVERVDDERMARLGVFGAGANPAWWINVPNK